MRRCGPTYEHQKTIYTSQSRVHWPRIPGAWFRLTFVQTTMMLKPRLDVKLPDGNGTGSAATLLDVIVVEEGATPSLPDSST